MCRDRKHIPSGLIILIVSVNSQHKPDPRRFTYVGRDSKFYFISALAAKCRSHVQCWDSIHGLCGHVCSQTLWLRKCTQVLWHSVALRLSLV